MTLTIFFLNRPDANLYGLDPSGTYGRESFPAIRERCLAHVAGLGVSLDFRQHHSFVPKAATSVVAGQGALSYELVIGAAVKRASGRKGEGVT